MRSLYAMKVNIRNRKTRARIVALFHWIRLTVRARSRHFPPISMRIRKYRPQNDVKRASSQRTRRSQAQRDLKMNQSFCHGSNDFDD